MVWARMACHCCLLNLGDLFCFQNEFLALRIKDLEERCYCQALSVTPHTGMHFNQLRVLKGSRYYNMEATYFYQQCLHSKCLLKGASLSNDSTTTREKDTPQRKFKATRLVALCQLVLEDFHLCLSYQPWPSDLSQASREKKPKKGYQFLPNFFIFHTVVLCLMSVHSLRTADSKPHSQFPDISESCLQQSIYHRGLHEQLSQDRAYCWLQLRAECLHQPTLLQSPDHSEETAGPLCRGDAATVKVILGWPHANCSLLTTCRQSLPNLWDHLSMLLNLLPSKQDLQQSGLEDIALGQHSLQEASQERALCEHLPVIRQLATSGQFLLIVPNIMVDILYILRREESAISFLEGELKRGNQYLLCQSFVSVMLVKPRMTRPDSDAWDLYNILDFFRGLLDSSWPGTPDHNSMITILMGICLDNPRNLSYPPQLALGMATEAGVEVKNILHFYRK
ncbi:hypothetical protein Celaphus_00018714 [Cervus elaphus hippelaphus]|uniref:SMG5 n=1 Tax=Cervus elaphus hippelaphus TaxID=46360 RepID=A0A212C6B4_CEREH|nr:hypothetical protein Celaphus_00018714 [Cervus elaphus hippelaphus]